MRSLKMPTDPQERARSPRTIAQRAIFCIWLSIGACASLSLGSLPAKAYRPFDGTDAAVAELNQIEIELQPIGVLQEGSAKTLIAPQNVFNYGFAQDWEAVLQGQLESQLSPFNRENLTATAVLLKHVVQPGVLQDKTGPSIATEFGLLLPSTGAASAVGASWDWIVSQRFAWGTLHLNAMASLTNDQHADLFFDAIVEGPATWKLRPVAEIFSDSLIGGARTYSGLVGVIWQARDDLALDLAVRHALSGGREMNEIRAGATIAFPLEALSQPANIWQPSRPAK
jgi:hypothetical protein